MGVAATAERRDGAVKREMRGLDTEYLEIGEDRDTQGGVGDHHGSRVYGYGAVQADGARASAVYTIGRGLLGGREAVGGGALCDCVGKRVSYGERRPGCIPGRLLVRQVRRELASWVGQSRWTGRAGRH